MGKLFPSRPGLWRLIICFITAVCFLFWGSATSQKHVPTASSCALISQAAEMKSASSEFQKPIHFLLIGQDRREEQAGARSDAMILCSFHKDSRTIIMTSILRDLYVPIPGYGSNRINASYAWGGMKLLKQTLQENLGLEISGCLEVDFSQFADIIDSLNGVTIHLRQDEATHINRKVGGALTEGPQRLNGQQALAYSRIRTLDPDGDISRTARQRKVISALLEAYQGAALTDILSMLQSAADVVTTDLSTGRILRYGMELFPMLSGARIISQRIPADGDFRYSTIDGMSVVTADMETVRQKLHDSLSSLK